MLLLGNTGSPYFGTPAIRSAPQSQGMNLWYTGYLYPDLMYTLNFPFHFSVAGNILITQDQKSVLMVGVGAHRYYENPQLFVHKFPLAYVVPAPGGALVRFPLRKRGIKGI